MIEADVRNISDEIISIIRSKDTIELNTIVDIIYTRYCHLYDHISLHFIVCDTLNSLMAAKAIRKVGKYVYTLTKD